MSLLTAEAVEGFVGSVLMKGFDQPAQIPDCHREWWELCTSKHPFVAIAAPRGHAKSTAITHSYLLACLLFRERSFALLISGTESQAILFLNDIKNELKDNDVVHQLFGVPRFLKDAETDIIVELPDGHRFRLMAKGSEQSLRGAKWAGKRPDLIVCDDIEEDEQVLNKDRRDKFRRWFMGALLPLRSDNGIVRIVGTILHMDSLLENLMPENQLRTKKKNQFLIIDDLKTYTNFHLPWKSVKYRAHNDDFSKILWPQKRTKEWLIAEREKYESMGLPEIYSQEFLNVPIDESHSYFKKSDLQDRLETDKTKLLRYYIAGDLAISLATRADYSVFLVGGMDDTGILHIVDVIRDRMDGQELINTIFALEYRYHPEVFAIEDTMITKSIGPFFYEECRKRNVFPNLYGIKPLTDKLSRARSIQGRMRAKAVRFDKDADWYATFESEVLRFPRDKHDDQVDALAHLGTILDKMVEAPTPEELIEEQYANEWNESGFADAGRSEWTWY